MVLLPVLYTVLLNLFSLGFLYIHIFTKKSQETSTKNVIINFTDFVTFVELVSSNPLPTTIYIFTKIFFLSFLTQFRSTKLDLLTSIIWEFSVYFKLIKRNLIRSTQIFLGLHICFWRHTRICNHSQIYWHLPMYDPTTVFNEQCPRPLPPVINLPSPPTLIKIRNYN